MVYAVETSNLSKRYASPLSSAAYALKDLNLTVERGAVYSLLGPNGSGKSTLLKILVGFVKPTSGNATILGWDIRREMDEIHRKVGYMPENVHPPSGRGLELLVRLASLNSPHDRNWLKDRAKDLLEKVGLWEHRHKKVSKYSYGMLRRWLFAHAFMNEPELVLLDEPTSGLDPLGQISVTRLIKQASNDGATVLLCSHDLSNIEKVASHIGLIREGHLVKAGRLAEILTQKRRKYTGFTVLLQTWSVRTVADYLKREGYEPETESRGVVLRLDTPETLNEILNLLPQHLNVKPVTISSGGLEQLFLDVLGGENEPD